MNARIFCCTVGKKPSVGNCYLTDVAEVEEFLASFSAQVGGDDAVAVDYARRVVGDLRRGNGRR